MSTIIVYKIKKRLVKSGKDTPELGPDFFPVRKIKFPS